MHSSTRSIAIIYDAWINLFILRLVIMTRSLIRSNNTREAKASCKCFTKPKCYFASTALQVHDANWCHNGLSLFLCAPFYLFPHFLFSFYFESLTPLLSSDCNLTFLHSSTQIFQCVNLFINPSRSFTTCHYKH